MQGESLFNDATSLVLFRVAVAVSVTAAGRVRPARGRRPVRLVAGGGVLIGLVVWCGGRRLRRRTQDAALETLIALVTPYAAYAPESWPGAPG